MTKHDHAKGHGHSHAGIDPSIASSDRGIWAVKWSFFRIRVGKEIGSAALIADGYHARTDGWTSLAVLAGALGVWLGFPLADPIIGLIITAAILAIVWRSAKEVISRALDGVDPDVLAQVQHAAAHVPGVRELKEIRARWLGHQLLAEVNIAVDPLLTVEQGHEIATEVHEQLIAHLPFLARAAVHVDPIGASGEEHHTRHDHGRRAVRTSTFRDCPDADIARPARRIRSRSRDPAPPRPRPARRTGSPRPDREIAGSAMPSPCD